MQAQIILNLQNKSAVGGDFYRHFEIAVSIAQAGIVSVTLHSETTTLSRLKEEPEIANL